MNEREILDTFRRLGAIITNTHVVYTSLKHGSAYVNKDAIYPHTKETSLICKQLALAFKHDFVEAVIAPAVGGVILSTRVAEHLTDMTGRDVLGVYAEKEEIRVLLQDKLLSQHTGDNFVIKRGYDKLIRGMRTLVVEDVATTGNSARKVVETTRAHGGIIVGVGVLCNRGGITPRDVGDVPQLISLTHASLEAWDENECPLCKSGVPINTEIGKGREYLARKRIEQ